MLILPNLHLKMFENRPINVKYQRYATECYTANNKGVGIKVAIQATYIENSANNLKKQASSHQYIVPSVFA